MTNNKAKGKVVISRDFLWHVKEFVNECLEVLPENCGLCRWKDGCDLDFEDRGDCSLLRLGDKAFELKMHLYSTIRNLKTARALWKEAKEE